VRGKAVLMSGPMELSYELVTFYKDDI
jgi:hypothetical protein